MAKFTTKRKIIGISVDVVKLRSQINGAILISREAKLLDITQGIRNEFIFNFDQIQPRVIEFGGTNQVPAKRLSSTASTELDNQISLFKLQAKNAGGENNSKWIEVSNLSELTGLGDILSSVDGVVGEINGVIDGLVALLNAAKTLLEVGSLVVSGGEDIQSIAVKAFIQALETAKAIILDSLGDILNFGIYGLPHFAEIDMERIIRQEIVGLNREEKTFAPKDEIRRIRNPDGIGEHWERIRRTGEIKKPTFEQFIKDVINSLNDEDDLLRPPFDASDKVSALLLVVASEDLVTFILGYLLVQTVFSPKSFSANSKLLYQYLRKAIGQAESLGRFDTVDSGVREKLLELLKSLRRTFSRAELGGDFIELIEELIEMFKRDSGDTKKASGDLDIDNIKISGVSENYQIVIPEKDATDLGVLPFDNVNSPNHANKATIRVDLFGKGVLTATYTSNGITRSEIVADTINSRGPRDTTKSKTVFIDVPIFTLFGFPWKSLSPEAQWDSNTNEIVAPDGNVFGEGTRVDLKFENDTDTVTQTIVLNRMNQLTDNLEGDSYAGVGDGYPQQVRYSIRPANKVTLGKVANFLGVTKTDAQNRFPVTIGNDQSANLTPFGKDLDKVEITCTISAAISFNSTFDASLIVNGIEYTAKESRIGVANAVFVFDDVELQESTNEMAVVSNIRQLKFFPQKEANIVNPNTGEYRVFSNPSRASIIREGGNLFRVEITSGNTVNTGNKEIVKHDAISQFSLVGEKTVSLKPPERARRAAFYRLTGIKNRNAVVYAYVQNSNKSDIKLLRISAGGAETNVPFAGTRSTFLSDIELASEAESTSYIIDVYQTLDNDLFRKLKTEFDNSQDKLKTMEEQDSQHKSDKATLTVTVKHRSTVREPVPPNWVSLSAGTFFDIIPIADDALSNLILSIKANIPEGPYDAFSDWLESMDDKISGLVDIFEKIRAAINAINSILQVGGTGMWALGISGANGMEGFKERLRKAPKNSNLSEARFATGFVFLTPDLQIGPLTGPGILDLFPNLPSAGTDNVKVPSTSIKNIAKDAAEKIKETAERTEKDAKAKINDIDAAAIRNLGIQAKVLNKIERNKGALD